MATGWFDRLLGSIADAGRAWIKIPTGVSPLEAAIELSRSLISEKGEASGAALSRILLERFRALGSVDRLGYYQFLSKSFVPDPERLRLSAEAYLADPSPTAAMRLGETAEPPRRELLRRLNMGQSGTATLVDMRAELITLLREHPELDPLDHDLQHLFTTWFNRGFLDLRRIDWHTSAAVLEKLIRYEAVHAIEGWEDLRRRLAPDRRCFAFFHPTLDDEPLIFVEVALVKGIAGAIAPLLDPAVLGNAQSADTAIFYSISNCQKGLRGISFGNFLIKQVVEELKTELPNLKQFSTLSPVPGFRKWLTDRMASGDRSLLRGEDRRALIQASGLKGAKGAFRQLLDNESWLENVTATEALRAPMMRLCARYLTSNTEGRGPPDPVARFHLGNGAGLERINWLANIGTRGLTESFGIMVNYLYDLASIEANHEAFVRAGKVAHSDAVGELMRDGSAAKTVTNLLSFRRRRGAS